MSDQTGWIDSENGTALNFVNIRTKQVGKLSTN